MGRGIREPELQKRVEAEGRHHGLAGGRWLGRGETTDWSGWHGSADREEVA